jgi:hypothetical protein
MRRLIAALIAVLVTAGLGVVSAGTAAEAHGTGTPFLIISYPDQQMCLGIAGGLHNSPAVLWTCDDQAANQRWHIGDFDPSNPLFTQLINDNGDCLGVQGGSTTKGARIYGWQCLGPAAPNQYWHMRTGCGISTIIANFGGSQYVLGTAGGAETAGTAIVQWSYPDVCDNRTWLVDIP